MVTKRTIIGIQERVESARNEIQAIIREERAEPGSTYVASRLEEIIQRDLVHALDDLDYAFQMAD